MAEGAQKKIALIAVSSLLLVAMVVVLVIVFQETEGKKPAKASASEKAITALCQTTDYQKTCIDSLHGHNSTDPKELIQVAMQSTIDYIKAALQNSTALRQAQTDKRAQAALDTCGELGNLAIDDLHRSYSKFRQFDITNVDDILLELKTWISGAMTHQQTCLDAFEKTDGDAGERMKDILKTSMQMTSNALAMVAEISTFLESMGVQGYQQSSRRRRRLLSEELELGSWVDHEKRRLLTEPPVKIRPNIIVAKDGSGKYKTINEALKGIPPHSTRTFVLYIKQGVYEETVHINNSLTNVMMIGDGPTKTRITGKLNFVDGVGTYQSATVAVQGDDFIARDIGFENSAGAEKLQAVALRASSDKSIYYNCHIDGYQDTLYTHVYRQFYRDCVISGTIDFVFGDSAAVFQGCTLLFRKPLKGQQNIITAQGRMDARQPTAFVLQNCTFEAAPELHPIKHEFTSYLGRPWKEFSRTIIMESYLDDHIHPTGWLPWDGEFALKTLFYTEFNNRGPASPKGERVKWPGLKELPPNRIKRFTAAEFLDGNRWIQRRRLPYAAGFMFPVPKEDPNIHYSPVSTEETKDLGSTAERKHISDLNNSTNNSTTPTPFTTPPAPPPATSPTPAATIAAPPTVSQVGAVSSTSLDTGSFPPAPLVGSDSDTGELVIDLSPAPASAPTSDVSAPPLLSLAGSSVNVLTTPPIPIASPALSPGGVFAAPRVSPVSSPVSAVTSSGGPASAPLSPNGGPISTPPPNAAASPPISLAGGTAPATQPETTASPITAPASAPQSQLSS
ncbi:hypothetical protein C2S52_019949 [Perilla frutescens var. hirtella]|nr:hypothetical protein C2S52_019949 [Perilla frutescens var. hirtella]